jgi:putative endonuclease
MYVYILKSLKDGSYYVGSSSNVAERIKSHNRGSNLATKLKRPWILIRSEIYDTSSLALKREKFLKTGDGRRILKDWLERPPQNSADGR